MKIHRVLIKTIRYVRLPFCYLLLQEYYVGVKSYEIKTKQVNEQENEMVDNCKLYGYFR